MRRLNFLKSMRETTDPEKDYFLDLRQYLKHNSPMAGEYGCRTKMERAARAVT